ncbi:MAG: tRNA threonylcarbamoyladenosine dehydratase [Clostridiales bacterium]|nr:tRNA threonylcarbamoyladenosine dehydratase [Clostridiales bacterium]
MREGIFYRSELLIGREALDKLAAAKIAVCGLGGVGSYAAEALVRSGVGALRLIDHDVFTPGNLNRQLPALHSTIGQSKAEVVAARVKDINPECRAEAVKAFIGGETVFGLLEGMDFVADAIDFVPGKIAIIKFCRGRGIPFVSSMGTGNRLFPERLLLSDISQTQGCPLARSVRQKLRAEGITEGVPVVWSGEPPRAAAQAEEDGKRVTASMVFVPAAAGLLLASAALRALLQIK